MEPAVKVIIPAYNEAAAISKVIGDIPNFIQETIVVDNGSTDLTSEVAKCAGATVLVEPNKGYGSACLKGIEYIQNSNQKTDIVVFLDCFYCDFPEQISEILAPILNHITVFVRGSRK